MATSSITANFRIDDPKEASAFVKAFLAPCDTTRKPRRAKSAVKCRFIASLDELKLYRKSLSVAK